MNALLFGRCTTLACVFFLGAALPAQDEEPDLSALRAEKLASEFLNKAPWTTSLADACKRAAATGKPIFTYFTRSFSP